LRYIWVFGSAGIENDAIAFSIKLGNPPSTHFVAETPPDSSIQIEAAVDGIPLKANAIHVGRDGRTPKAEGESIPLNDIIADAALESQVRLPTTGVTLHAWYVPSPEVFTKQEMDPAVRAALEALGYIGK
jgi:hypothetical protein